MGRDFLPRGSGKQSIEMPGITRLTYLVLVGTAVSFVTEAKMVIFV